MIKRLICKIFGHKWILFDKPSGFRCLRCRARIGKRFVTIKDFEKYFPARTPILELRKLK